MSAIPTAAREAVRNRCQGRCERCGGPGAHHHHRQRRREGKHGVENLVYLCPTDHEWVHAHPKQATEEGFIIPFGLPREHICEVGVQTPWGWRYLSPDGQYLSTVETERGECDAPN